MGRRRSKVSRRVAYGPGRDVLGPRRDVVFADGVLADPWTDLGDDGGDPGTAGVREPRRPKPNGPLSGAGELPLPEPPAYLVLADPRR